MTLLVSSKLLDKVQYLNRGPHESMVRLVSVQSKLTRLVVVSLATALVVAALISMWREAERFLATKQETMLATARVFAAAASAAAAKQDGSGVAQVLRGMAHIPDLLYAEAKAVDGSSIATVGGAVRLSNDYNIGDAPSQGSLLMLMRADTVAVTTPIINAGIRVGSLSLVAKSDLRSRLRSVLGYAFAGSMIALIPGLLMSRGLKRSITRPLHELGAAMDNVAVSGVYQRVAIEAPDAETARLTASFNDMIERIGVATDKILAREDEIIMRLSLAGELRDDQTGQHVVRVAKISRLVAERMGLDRGFVDDLCRASPMHDVGKISVPDAILHKPGRLDPAEREEMEKHALRGYEILAGSESQLVKLAAEIALSHHERWDGTGYPNQLSGADIPISGRLTAVADVCDALFSERPYKTPWSPEQVRQHFIDNAGTHFDPACVHALLESWTEVRSLYLGT